MKRCIKWLIDWWELVVGFSISGLLGIALTIIIFISVDKIPATPSDYEQLERQVDVIQQNPDLLLKTDCNININGEIITVELENDECKVIAKYDKNFKVLSSSKEDKSVFWLEVLLGALLLGVSETILIGYILLLVIFFLTIVVKGVFERVKKLKAKLPKK